MPRLLAIVGFFVLLATPALAADCPGNAGALGTSRVLTVDPVKLPRVGTLQYPETLPLRDHEIVLTFDDGPLPGSTTRILRALKTECVKATFFVVGNMARAYPAVVHRAYAEGHTIATHSQQHRVLGAASEASIEQDFERGSALIAAALGNHGALAPFYRFPGLSRTAALEHHLASHGVMAWSADVNPEDWRSGSADEMMQRLFARLDRKGRGIVVLHDTQARTAGALPRLLRALKARGYRIVHVVAA